MESLWLAVSGGRARLYSRTVGVADEADIGSELALDAMIMAV